MFQALFWIFSPFWSSFGWMCARVSLRAGNPWKTCVGVFETDFKQFQFVFRQTTCTYSESWGPVEKIFWPPTRGVAVGKKMTQNPKFGSKKFFPKFCQKKHSLITQNRFWLIFVKKIEWTCSKIFPDARTHRRTDVIPQVSNYFVERPKIT